MHARQGQKYKIYQLSEMKKFKRKAAKMLDILFELDILCTFEYQTRLDDLHLQQFCGG
jgi:hypothetical protein